jgi:hypothetical protein
VAIADVAMIPNTQATGLFGPDRDAVLREWLACTQPIPHQIREDLASGAQDTRAYLDSARLDPGRNLPSEALKMPGIFTLVRIPLDRTVVHPLTPNPDSPVKNEKISPALDLAGDPLHLRLTYPLPHRLC